MLKGLVFFLDINHDGNSMNATFTTKIEELGGKISKRLDKQVTHLVWGQGKIDTLGKALQFENIKIISTLWLKDCENERWRD